MSRLLFQIPKYIIVLTLAALNILCVAALLLCAYSMMVPPQEHASVSYLGLLFPVVLAATAGFLAAWFLLGLMGLSLGSGKKRRSAYWGMLISLTGMAGSAGSIRTYWPLNLPADPPDGAIKVMSYNVYGLSNPDGLPWNEHPTVRYLIESRADIICLQEANAVGRDYIDTLFAQAYPYRLSETHRGMGFACLSRWPIVGSTPIEYTSKGNSSLAYDIVVGNDTLLVINNHFESYKLQDSDREEYKEVILRHDSADVRRNILDLRKKLAAANIIRGPQADSVAHFIEQHPERLIICCGDFNDASLSYTHYRLTRRLDDAYTRSGNGPGPSYNKSGMYFRIDHILCSPSIKPFGAKVDDGIKSSDHYPIYCWLQLPQP